jgi:hypothetical protein
MCDFWVKNESGRFYNFGDFGNVLEKCQRKVLNHCRKFFGKYA